MNENNCVIVIKPNQSSSKMNIIITILAGFISGVLAKFIMPGKQKLGFLKTTLLGIAGAFVGGFLFNRDLLGEFNLTGFFFSALGAVIVLLVYGLITKNKS